MTIWCLYFRSLFIIFISYCHSKLSSLFGILGGCNSFVIYIPKWHDILFSWKIAWIDPYSIIYYDRFIRAGSFLSFPKINTKRKWHCDNRLYWRWRDYDGLDFDTTAKSVCRTVYKQFLSHWNSIWDNLVWLNYWSVIFYIHKRKE